jgi:hypothetical protein
VIDCECDIDYHCEDGLWCTGDDTCTADHKCIHDYPLLDRCAPDLCDEFNNICRAPNTCVINNRCETDFGESCSNCPNDCGVCGSGGCGGNHCDESFCSTSCPCTYGQADCDSDAECVDNLKCGWNTGQYHGCDYTEGFDACVPIGESLNGFCGNEICDQYGTLDENETTCPEDCSGPGNGPCDTDEDCDDLLFCTLDNCIAGACYHPYYRCVAVCNEELDRCEAYGSAQNIEASTAQMPSLKEATCGTNCDSNVPDLAIEWTATVTGTHEIDTCSSGTTFDTMLFVYNESGTELIECNDDDSSCSASRSKVTIDAVANTKYLIHVDGFYQDSEGAFDLNITEPGGCTPDCGSRVCGPVPNGCGTSCGPDCPSGEFCSDGTCVPQSGGDDIGYTDMFSNTTTATDRRAQQVTPEVQIGSSAGWETVNLSSPVSVTSGQKVWLAWVFENNPGIRADDGTPGRASSGVGWSGDMPSDFGSASFSDYIYSIYATYSGGGICTQNSDCEDSNPCTDNICDTGSGNCTFPANTASCDDAL